MQQEGGERERERGCLAPTGGHGQRGATMPRGQSEQGRGREVDRWATATVLGGCAG
jgi:hypothetical protein